MFDRRTVLAAVPGFVVALAGCTDAGSDGGTTARTESPATASPGTDTDAAAAASGDASTPDDTPTATGTSTDDLDLREANVTAVSTAERGDGYRFDVTLYHDDDGEGGYANWWQVEAPDGTRLGRRDLAHPHGTREFTRSTTVAVPDGTACVVVRGHDETHGYGGRAALVDPGSGATRFVDQGPDPRAFGAADCP